MAKQVASVSENLHTKKGEQVIIAFSSQKYLLGALRGFCHLSKCKFGSVIPVNSHDFFRILRTESPVMVFVDLSYMDQVLNTAEWNETVALLKNKNIDLCGIVEEKNATRSLIAESLFIKLFDLPINIEELLEFVRLRLVEASERRIRERRTGIDRREQGVSDDLDAAKAKAKAKAKAILAETRKIKIGSLSVDYEGMKIEVDHHQIEITPKEFRLIDLFIQALGRIVTPEEIIKEIWPENTRATKADVHQCIYTLRHKLEKDPKNPQLLVTVKGFGYKLNE